MIANQLTFFVVVTVVAIMIIPAAYADYLSQFGSAGVGDGQFLFPSGIALDSSGNIYVTDQKNNRTEEFSSDGAYQSQFGSTGLGNGQFRIPSGIARDSSGNIYVADFANNRVEKFDSAGAFQGWIGSCYYGTNCDTSTDPDTDLPKDITKGFCSDCVIKLQGSLTSSPLLVEPNDITLDSSGNIYVTTNYYDRVEKFDSAGAFKGWIGGCNSGTNCDTSNLVTTGFCSDCWVYYGNTGWFGYPNGITLDSSGNIYVTNLANNRVEKFDSAGAFKGWIGGCNSGTNCDTSNLVTTGFCSDCVGLAGHAPGQFLNPSRIALDSSGNIYVTDSGNYRVEKFDSGGAYQSQFGSTGFGDGQFQYPNGIALDSSGNIYVIDSINDRVEKFSPAIQSSTTPEFPINSSLVVIVAFIAGITLTSVKYAKKFNSL